MAIALWGMGMDKLQELDLSAHVMVLRKNENNQTQTQNSRQGHHHGHGHGHGHGGHEFVHVRASLTLVSLVLCRHGRGHIWGRKLQGLLEDS